MSEIENVDEIISLENLGFGNILRNEREKKGLSHSDVGKELHLDESIVSAIENNNLDKLPEPAYVCGYIRNYARFMELDPEPLVKIYKKDVSLKSNLTSVNSISQALEKKQEKRTVFFLIFLVVLLAMGSFLAWQLWKNNKSSSPLGGQEKSNESSFISLSPNNKSALQGNILQDNALPLATASRTKELNSNPEEESNTGVSVEAINQTSPPTEEFTEINSAVSSSEVSQGNREEEVAEETKLTSLPSKAELKFSFSKNSWISVKDGKNKSLIYDLVRKGEELILSGIYPIDVFLGDGTGVELMIDGQVYNFSEHINKKNIAKFIIKAE